MFRSLAARAVLPVALALTGFVVICCVLLYAIMEKDLTASALAEEQSLAAAVIRSAQYTMLKDDREGLANIVTNVGTSEAVAHLRILNPRGEIAFSSKSEPNLPEKGVPARDSAKGRRFIDRDGTEVLALTVPILNEPACASAACHVHPRDQKVLGVLDIGVPTAPLKENLARMRNRMTAFCLMVLCLSIGGVAALLKGSVFTPVRRLVEASGEVARGELTPRIPQLKGELGILSQNLRRVSDELHQFRSERGTPRGTNPRE